MKMECGQARGLLEKFHDKELREGDYQAVAEHLKGCGGCSKEMEKLVRISGIVVNHYNTLSAGEDFSGLWSRIATGMDIAAHEPSVWRRGLGKIFWIPKPVWATIGAVAVALLVLFAYLPVTQHPAVASNDCIIDTVEADNSSVMVYETDQTKMKIIWVTEQQKGDITEEGVTS
jgi:hypothetical protein